MSGAAELVRCIPVKLTSHLAHGAGKSFFVKIQVKGLVRYIPYYLSGFAVPAATI